MQFLKTMGTKLFLLTIACTIHKRWNYVKCAYFFLFDWLNKCLYLSHVFLTKKGHFFKSLFLETRGTKLLENMILKNKGTKIFLTPIVCTMYKKV